MKTQNFKNGLMVLATALVFVINAGKTNAQSASDDVVLPLTFTNEEGVVMEPLEMVKNNSTEIKGWLNQELKKEIENSDLPQCKVSTKVYLELDEQGKVAKYSFKDDKSEVGIILNEILSNAPEFEPVAMNGHAAKMVYEIPVTINIR
jgi:hypothetical protein